VSRKRAQKEPKARAAEAKRGRPKGANRARVVLSVVETDSTFDLVTPAGPGHPHWLGKCIHCGTKLYVTDLGGTDATLEHIQPLCDGGDPTDPRNLALACRGCNNRKGIDHDQHAGKGGRADEVIRALQAKRLLRWREPVQVPARAW